MKKKIVVKVLTIIIFLFILLFIFFKFSEKKEEYKIEISESENNSYNSNIIKKVNYISNDANGNTYIIDASEGEIDINNGDIIYLTDVKALIKLKNSNPSNKIITLESAVANKKELLKSLLNSVLEKKKNIVELRKNTIRDISPLNILEKGYSVIYSKGKIAKKTADFKINDDVTIKIIDGVVSSNITKIRKD